MAISLRESLEVGLADIWMRKIRSLVTVIGIILGVMSIMVVLAIVNGMNQSTLRWMEERGGLNKIEVHPNWSMEKGEFGRAYFTLTEINYIRSQLSEVKAFNPTLRMYGIEIKRGRNTYDAQIIGALPDLLVVEDWGVGQGRFFNEYDLNNNNNVVVLGTTVASELFGRQNPLGSYVTVNGQALLVIGIMQKKEWLQQGGFGNRNMLEYMNQRTFIPLSTMLHKISPGSKIFMFDLKVSSPSEASSVKTRLENIILNLRQGKKVFEVSSAKEQMDAMKKNSLIFTVIFVLIAVVSLLVGGIVIMNIMLASVQERTREIGVRLAVGARRKDIFTQFLIQTVLITSLGGIVGIILGYTILGVVGKYLEMELIASVQMIWTALIVAVGVGLIFGITPAIRASNLNPVTALRNE